MKNNKSQIKINLWLPVLITIIGWFILSQLQSYQDRVNKIRDLKTSYLIESYHKLAMAANRDSTQFGDYVKDIESAVASIQLFGSEKEIEIITTNFSFNNSTPQNPLNWKIEFDPILNELRNSLRKELNLDSIKKNVYYIRLTKPKN